MRILKENRGKSWVPFMLLIVGGIPLVCGVIAEIAK